MHDTAHHLQEMAHFISCYGLHSGDQMAHEGAVLTFDISALAYYVTEGTTPDAFFTDEVTAIQLIEASEPAMACLRAISDVLDSDVCETRVDDGTYVPDYVEHVSTWVMTPQIGRREPPSVSEVIGRILRAANHAQTHAA